MAAITSKLITISILLCAIQICLAGLATEIAPVTDETLRKQGYTCQGKNLPPMKTGEENKNFDKTICMSVKCGNGYLEYMSCLVFGVPEGIKIIPADPTKPYPECCSRPDLSHV